LGGAGEVAGASAAVGPGVQVPGGGGDADSVVVKDHIVNSEGARGGVLVASAEVVRFQDHGLGVGLSADGGGGDGDCGREGSVYITVDVPYSTAKIEHTGDQSTWGDGNEGAVVARAADDVPGGHGPLIGSSSLVPLEHRLNDFVSSGILQGVEEEDNLGCP